MFKKFFKKLFGKKSSDDDTRKIEDSCNYWADKKDAVDYSPSFTAQDVLSSTETVNASDTTLSKKTEEDKKNTSGGCGRGCGGDCIGGCGGGCL